MADTNENVEELWHSMKAASYFIAAASFVTLNVPFMIVFTVATVFVFLARRT